MKKNVILIILLIIPLYGYSAYTNTYISLENEDGISIDYNIRIDKSTKEVLGVYVENQFGKPAIATSTTGSLVIPSIITYKGKDYTVTHIGSGAFNGCEGLTSITIPNTVISITGFENCTGLTSITIPNSVKSISGFNGCTNITSITIPNGVTYLGGFSGCTGLTQINIPNSVQTIAPYAFKDCTGLQSIIIPNSITSIGKNAFEGCIGLSSITIPYINNLDIGNSAFGGCSGELIINSNIQDGSNGVTCPLHDSRFNTITIGDSVTTIGKYAFSGVYTLEKITLGRNLITIGDEAFSSCSNLSDITIPDNVSTIGNNAFKYCRGLTSITIGNGISKICSNAFSDCDNLSSVSISDIASWCGITFDNNYANPLSYAHHIYINGNEVTDLIIPEVSEINPFAFYRCTGLITLIIPDCVSTIGVNAFCECTNLNSIDIGNGVVSVNAHAFEGCTALKTVIVGNNIASVGSDAFKNCMNLTTTRTSDISAWCNISFDNYYANPIYYTHGLYLLDNKITNLVVPGNVRRIGENSFYNCTDLESVTISNNVTTIGNNAFYGCNKLTSVIVPNSITTIGDNVFYGCTGEVVINCNLKDGLFSGSKISSVIIGDDVTTIGNSVFYNLSTLNYISVGKSVTSIGVNAFFNCKGTLTLKCDIPDGTSSSYILNNTQFSEIIISDEVKHIGDYAFCNLTKLNAITIGNGLESIGINAFSGCNNLTVNIEDVSAWCRVVFKNEDDCPYHSNTVIHLIGENVNVTIPDDITSIRNYCFYNCSNLTSIVIPSGVMSIGDYAFYNCDALTSISLAEGLTYIGNQAFRDCNGLVSIIIPEGVISIGDYVFYLCGNLNSITLPDSLISIGASAFYGCTNLTSIEIPTNVNTIGELAFKSCPKLSFLGLPSSISMSKLDEIFSVCTSLNTVKFRNMESFEDCLSILCSKSYSVASASFYLNDALITDITLPDDIDNICSNAFSGCKFEQIIIPNIISSIESNAFKGCSYLKKVSLPGNLTSMGTGVFSNCIALQEVYIPGNITTIGDNTFEGCNSLSKISISDGIESIGANAFKSCSSLDSVVFPSSLRTIGEGAFSGCSSLVNLVLNEDLLSIGKEAFKGCGITSITLPPYLTSIGEYAFNVCRNLSTVIVTINKFIPISVSVFSSIKGGAVLYTPYSQFDKYNTDYTWRQFFSNAIEGEPQINNIFTLPMPNGDGILDVSVRVIGIDPYEVEIITDELATIPSETTSDLIIPSSIVNVDGKKFYIKGIGSEALKGTNITSISIPEGVEYIEEDAISQCSELSTIYLPRSLTSIGNNFSGCNNLTSFYFSKRKPDEVAISNDIRDNISEQAVLYVPAGTKENYANHAIWGKCLQIIEKGPISAGDISAKYGTLAELPIILNEPTTIMGLQFKLTLPKGVSVVDNNGTLVASLTDRTSNMIIMGRKDPDAVNSYLFIILSLEGKAISGNEGNIATIRLSISNDIDVKKHDIFIDDAFLTSNTFSTISSECISEITIKDMILGDVNNDNDIDIADVIGVVNYILKNPSETFILGSADINMDGDIDIADVIGVVNIILRNTSSPSQLSSLRQLPSNVIFNMLDPE